MHDRDLRDDDVGAARGEATDAATEAYLSELRADVLGEDATLPGPFGPRRQVYADHVASGRPLGGIERWIERTVLPSYANTHTEDSATGLRTSRLAARAARYLKTQLGADDRYAIAFPGTGTTGAIKRLQEILGVVVPCRHRATVRGSLPEEERPVVIVGPYEHHSNEVSWRESIADVVVVPLAANGTMDLQALEAIVSDPSLRRRPRIGSFSAASNVTGVLTDVIAVARIARRHGAVVAFDFAASGPYVQIDVRPGSDAQIDAVTLSPHKFLGGPGSPGLLLFHRDLYRLTAPTTAGGGTVAYVGPESHHFVDDVEMREDAGTPAIVQRLRAAAAFRVKECVGVRTIQARERAWTERALRRLRAHPRVELLGPSDAPRLPVASFLLRDPRDDRSASPSRYLHPRLVVRLLSDLFGVQGRAGCSCAGPYGHALLGIDRAASGAYLRAIEAGWEGVKPGWSRISFHWLADRAEVDHLLDAVTFLADHGHRFAPLYAFDWRSGAWRWRGGALARALSLPDASEASEGAPGTNESGDGDGAAFDLDAPAWTEAWRGDREAAYRDALDAAARLSERLVEAAPAAGTEAHEPPLPPEVDPSLVFFRT